MKQVYFAVYAQLNEDGTVAFFSEDSEALVGSMDGYVWDEDTEEWTEDEPKNTAYKLLSGAIDALNKSLPFQEV